jgi:hypothetical protein
MTDEDALYDALAKNAGLEEWVDNLRIDKAELLMRIRLLHAALFGPGALSPTKTTAREFKQRLEHQLRGWAESLASAHEDEILQGGWVCLVSIHELRALDVLTRSEAVVHRANLFNALTAARPELVEGFGELPEPEQ